MRALGGIVLMLAMVASGCLQEDARAPTPEEWRVEGAPTGNLMAPLRLDEPVRVVLAQARHDPEDEVRVRVENAGEQTLRYGGTDCGLHVARPEPDAWVIFASAPGNMDEVLRTVEPGEACATTVPLDSFHGFRQAAWGSVELPEGDYRVVFLAHVPGEPGTVLAHAPLRIAQTRGGWFLDAPAPAAFSAPLR